MSGYTTLRIVRDDGREMTISDDPAAGWFLPLESLEGFAELSLAVDARENVGADGSALLGKRAEAKDRTVEGAVYIGPDADGARARAISFLNPRHSFEAHLAYRGRTRWCAGELSGVRVETNGVRRLPELTFTLLCLDPHFRSETSHGERFGEGRPMFGFPYVSHMRGPRHPEGAPCSVSVYDGRNTVQNGGDMPCGYVLRCLFTGAVRNPSFSKDGRRVCVSDAFAEGDALEIDFEARPPRVEKNGANCIHRCTRDSSFVGMLMEPGANEFDYTCDDAAHARGHMRVSLSWHDRYLGI